MKNLILVTIERGLKDFELIGVYNEEAEIFPDLAGSFISEERTKELIENGTTTIFDPEEGDFNIKVNRINY